MSLQIGYKQTECGSIPDDWEVSPLGSFVDGIRSIRYGIVQPGKFDPEGRYLIRGQDYSKGWADPSQFFKVSAKIEGPYKNARVRVGDLIMTIVGASTGHTEIIPQWLDGANLTQTTARIAIDADKGSNSYFLHILKSPFGQKNVSAFIKGGAQPGLNCGDLERFTLPHPMCLSEQRKIAAVLNDIDDLIASLDALIAKKRDIKQAAMQQLLTGKTRLPGFEGEWVTVELGTLCSMKSGVGITSKSISEDGPYPVFGANGTRGFTSTKTHSGVFPLIGRVGALCGNIQIARDDFFASEHAIVAEPKGKTDPEWLALALSRLGLNRLSEASAQPVLTVGKLAVLRLYTPTDPLEQREISKAIFAMEAELNQLAVKKSKLCEVRDGMMQQLLTGRIRLV